MKAAGLIQTDANRFWLFPGNLAHAACVTALSLKAAALCSSLSPTSLPEPGVCTRSAEGGQSSLEEGWSKPSGCLEKDSTLRHGEEEASSFLFFTFPHTYKAKLLKGFCGEMHIKEVEFFLQTDPDGIRVTSRYLQRPRDDKVQS